MNIIQSLTCLAIPVADCLCQWCPSHGIFNFDWGTMSEQQMNTLLKLNKVLTDRINQLEKNSLQLKFMEIPMFL